MTDTSPHTDGSKKVAALLLALGQPASERLMRRLNQEELRSIGAFGTKLAPVTKDVLDALVDEFSRGFAAQSGLPSDFAVLSEMLDRMLGEKANGSKGEGGASPKTPVEDSDGPAKMAALYRGLSEAQTERLASILTEESDDVVAHVLSRLPNTKAGDVLAALPPDRRGRVTRALMALDEPDAVVSHAIAEGLTAALGAADPDAEKSQKRQRAAAVLNALERDAARDILALLAETDASSAAQLEALLFDFTDLTSIDAKARVLILDGVTSDRVANALHGADDGLREAVLSALGQRTRRMAEAELGSGLAPSPETVREARRQIAARALSLAGEGRITIGQTADGADVENREAS